MRILRLLRVLKLTRYSRSLSGVREVLHRDREALITSFALLLGIMVLAASALFLVERDAQPEAFSSIPAAM